VRRENGAKREMGEADGVRRLANCERANSSELTTEAQRSQRADEG